MELVKKKGVSEQTEREGRPIWNVTLGADLELS